MTTRHTGTSGNGVLIGIVDSGIDAAHPAFAGRLRVVRDQTQQGSGRGRFRNGRVLTGAELGKSTYAAAMSREAIESLSDLDWVLRISGSQTLDPLDQTPEG